MANGWKGKGKGREVIRSWKYFSPLKFIFLWGFTKNFLSIYPVFNKLLMRNEVITFEIPLEHLRGYIKFYFIIISVQK